jgi:hypothetical protein
MTYGQSACQAKPSTEDIAKDVRIGAVMRKDTRLTFRISADLKKSLEEVADREGRSVAQVCEALLKDGLESYRKHGSQFLQRIIARRKPR